jgi:hypothetical protein
LRLKGEVPAEAAVNRGVGDEGVVGAGESMGVTFAKEAYPRRDDAGMRGGRQQ